MDLVNVLRLAARHEGHDEDHDMDHDMGGGMGAGGGMDGSMPLSPAVVDFSNKMQASAFLDAMLDDDDLKIIGNAFARYFWYGIAAVIFVAALANFARIVTLRSR